MDVCSRRRALAEETVADGEDESQRVRALH